MFHDLDEIINTKIKNLNFDIEIDKSDYINNFKLKFLKLMPSYLETINSEYTEKIILSDQNKILLYSNDNIINKKNIISIIVYRKHIYTPINTHYYIFLFGINKKLRKFGYGSMVIQDFFSKIKLENKSNTNINIVLKSIYTSLNFYKSIGFLESKEYFKYALFYSCDKDHFQNTDEYDDIEKSTFLLDYFFIS